MRVFSMAAALAVLGSACPAWAQDVPAGSTGDLRTEMTRRYDAALATATRPDVIAADDGRFLWASEAKVACGIAVGYLKRGTADADWIGRCRTFADRSEQVVPPGGTPQPRPQPEPPGPPVAPEERATCTASLPVPVFFDWNVATPLPEGAKLIADVVGSARACGWTALRLVGHTDSSGTEEYNLSLSQQRADAVKGQLTAAGFAGPIRTQAVGEADLAVATTDGVRELKNRRVEITLDGQPQ